jgi:hypothetical protein
MTLCVALFNDSNLFGRQLVKFINERVNLPVERDAFILVMIVVVICARLSVVIYAV